MESRFLRIAAVAAPVTVFLIVYLANAGHGFLLDDFDWVLNSRVRQLSDIPHALGGWSGFFRPVVGATFTVDEWLFGARPFGYALTNILLALACGWAVSFLARGFSLSRGAAALAGLVWLMNLYFTRTAIMWISGRTALVVTLFGVLSAGWLMRGRVAAAVGCLLLALLAKEEAVLLPVILLGWLAIARSTTGRSPIPIGRWCILASGALALYLAVRALTPAMMPATAPDYYRFTFAPAAIGRNLAEYADRTSTLAVVVMVLAMALLGWRRRLFDQNSRLAVLCGLVWLIGALGLACILPVRSDLYAAVPGAGICLVAAAVVDRLWDASTTVRRRRALVAAIALPILLSPAYWLRTQRLSRQAEFSATALVDLDALTRHLPGDAHVRIDDVVQQPGKRLPNMAGAFGAQLGAAYELQTGRRLDLALEWEIAPEDRASDAAKPGPHLRLAVIDGRLQSVR